MKVYHYARCGTCRKALKWLDEHGLDYEAISIVSAPPTVEELRAIVQLSGRPIRKLFNTSGKRYRELKLKDQLPQMSDEEMLHLLASDGMLIKRPLVTDGKKATVGFAEKEFQEIWG